MTADWQQLWPQRVELASLRSGLLYLHSTRLASDWTKRRIWAQLQGELASEVEAVEALSFSPMEAASVTEQLQDLGYLDD